MFVVQRKSECQATAERRALSDTRQQSSAELSELTVEEEVDEEVTNSGKMEKELRTIIVIIK